MTSSKKPPFKAVRAAQNRNSTIEGSEFDDFERGLLPVIRQFLVCFDCPAMQTWRRANTVAAECWGESMGLLIAYKLQKVVCALYEARQAPIDYCDPLAVDSRSFLTADEIRILRMLHYMRRDDTPAAREAVAAVTENTMDPHVIRAGLSFAHQFPASYWSGIKKSKPQTKLRLVK